METTPTTTQQDPVKGHFAAALRQYQYYSHGRSIRKFCDDEGLDYQKFCKYAREHGPSSGETKKDAGDILPATFIEVRQQAEDAPIAAPTTIREVRVRFSNGMILHGRSDNLDGLVSMVRRMLAQ